MNVCIDRRIFTLQAHGGISRLWSQLTPALRAVMPGVMFSDTEPADVFLSTYYARPTNGARAIAVIYDMIPEQYGPLGLHNPDALAKRAAIQQADVLVAISDQTASDVERLTGRACVNIGCGGGETVTRALPSAVLSFRQRHGLNKPYVLTVGRRALYKNVQVLYQAWRLWGADAYLVTVGGEDELPQDATFDRAFPGVRKHLSLQDDELAAAYSGALALVYPSFYEGFGLPVVEALACGCPVLGGEVIRPVAGDAGCYANVYRPLSVVQALNEAIQPTLRLERAQIGLERAKQFSWAAMAQNLANVIREVTV